MELVVILNSGHMVPIDQPVWASEIVQNFLQKAQKTSPPKVTPVKICPSTNDWIRIENTCLKVVNQSLTYDEAMKYCQDQESSLVEPKSSLSNSLVQHFARTSAGKSIIWIGINDKNNEGSPEYSSDHSPLEWSNWENGQPDNWQGNEDCMIMYVSNGKWGDVKCDAKYPFICQA